VFELEHPELTIRICEWRGILEAVKSLVRLDEPTRWLDFNCGNGGLIRYCRECERCQITGCEDGPNARKAVELDIAVSNSSQLESLEWKARLTGYSDRSSRVRIPAM